MSAPIVDPVHVAPASAADSGARGFEREHLLRTPQRWIVAASVPLVVAVVLQRLGEIVYLTRLDRVLDPMRMAARDVDLWNPYWDLGAVQFQTVGYWIPFDAFFALGDALRIPAWLTERLFIATLLVVALAGAVRIADALGVGRPIFRVVAGFAYATSALVLSRVGWQSVFAMGAVFLPWVLVPLVRGAEGGSTRRAAARSAVAIALIGGANASVTIAVLPAPLLYLLTRRRGPRRASLLRWWILCVPLATSWWMVGVVLYARYGPDVLSYTEQIDDIVRFSSVFEVLRGTSDWVMRLGAIDPAGTWFALRSAAVVTTAVVAALGLAGLASRRMPERAFLVLCLLIGVAVVGGGYGGLFGNPAAGEYRSLLGGPLEALRNVYKFQPLVLLPLALGLAHVLTAMADHRVVSGGHVRRAAAVAVPAAAVVAAAWPLWGGLITRGPGFDELPPAWEEVQDHLDATAEGRVLVVPGVPDADFEWGFTSQLPVLWGSDATWATRSQAPLSGPESLEVLDAIELAIERGGDRGLPAFLRRAGFSTVLVPNDQRSAAAGAPPPEVVDAALDASGLQRTVGFGAAGYGFGDLRQIEVYAVPGAERLSTYPASSTTWLSGDIESTSRIPAESFGERPYLLVEDPPSAAALDQLEPEPWVITDGNRAYTVDHGFNRNNRSYVHGPAEEPFDDPGAARHHTVSSLDGFLSVRASSTGPGIFVRDSPASQPANTIDGDLRTSWQPLRRDVDGPDQWGSSDPWVEYVFERPRTVDRLRVSLLVGALGSPAGIDVRVDADRGSVDTQVEAIEQFQTLPVPPGPTSRIRVTIPRAAYRAVGDVIGIRELTVPGAPVARRLVVPSELSDRYADPRSPDPAWVLTRIRPAVSPLVHHDSEEQIRRIVHVPKEGTFTMRAVASAAERSRVVRELGSTPRLRVAADSTWGDRAEVAPRNLVDHDPDTVWRSAITTAQEDPHAVVWLDWSGEREIDRLQLRRRDEDARPRSVVVRGGGRVRRADVGADGWVEFPPLRAREMEITIRYGGTSTGAARPLGLTGIDVPAIADLYPDPVDPDRRHRVPCGAGLGVTVDGRFHGFSAATTTGALVRGTSVEVTPCAPDAIRLEPGPATIDARSGSSLLTIDQIVIGNPPTLGVPDERPRRSTVRSWGSTRRAVAVEAGGAGVLVVNEMYNDGWAATSDDLELEAVRIDGWRQGFVLPAGGPTVVQLAFAPDRTFKAGLALGLVGVAALVVLAGWPGRARPGNDRPPAAAGTPWTPLLVMIVVAGAIWAVGIAAVALPVLWWIRARRPGLLPWIAFGALAGAGATVVVAERALELPGHVWGVFSPLVSASAALSLLCVLAALVPVPSGPRPVADRTHSAAAGEHRPGSTRRRLE